MSRQTFQILLALADGPMHGYAIIQDVAERTQNEVRLTASTLYDALARLVDQEFIEEVSTRTWANSRSERSGPSGPAERRAPGGVQGPPPIKHDERRRYYALTASGRKAAKEETRRLERTVALAKELL